MVILQKNRGMNHFLELTGMSDGKGYEYNMLLNNSFRFIPPVQLQELDNKMVLLYKIDGSILLGNWYQKKAPGKEELLGLIGGIRQCIEELKPYLLEAGQLVLDIRYILYQPEENSFRFLYGPGQEGDFVAEMKHLLEDMMLIFDHQDQDGVVLLYDIYSRFLQGNFSPEMFCRMADELVQRENGQSKFDDSEMKWGDGEKENWEQYEVSGTVVGENCFGRTEAERTGTGRTGTGRTGTEKGWGEKNGIEQNSGRHLHILYMLIAIFVTAAAGLSCLLLGVKSYKAVTGFVFFGMLAICAFLIQRSKEEFHEKESVQAYAATITVGEDYGMEQHGMAQYGQEQHKVEPHGTEQHETAQYGTEQHKVEPHGTVQQLTPYLAGSDKEPIFISEGLLKIGRVMSQVDYCLNVPGISRVHAQIEKSDSQVMLMDVGSTNGTYVNGRRLPANQKEEIHHGDVVSFAGEEYYCL